MGVGLPDSSTLSTYGGAKVNARPIVNPQTDRDASAANQAFADAAGMTRTAVRAWVLFGTDTTTGGMVLLDWDAVWKAQTPTLPTLTRLATGNFRITFPASVTDELGTVHAVSFRRAKAQVHSGVTPYATIMTTGPNTASLALFTIGASPTATDAAGTAILVEIG